MQIDLDLCRILRRSLIDDRGFTIVLQTTSLVAFTRGDTILNKSHYQDITTGVVVGGAGHTAICPAGAVFSNQQIRHFLHDAIKSAYRRQATEIRVGGWLDTDTGRFWLDEVTVHVSIADALAVARERHEKAVYDLDTRTEHQV